MPRPVIAYDQDLPEIVDREPHLRPDAYLRRSFADASSFEVVSGRRPSDMLLVEGLRKAVDEWRSSDYPGLSDVSRRLFGYWFDEDHVVDGERFRFHFAQREAMETLAFLVEVEGVKDVTELIQKFFVNEQLNLTEKLVEYQTTTAGRRQLRRFVPERGVFGVQELPPEQLRRYALKMATGSGKTVVMAMSVAWAHLNHVFGTIEGMSSNFLILAPNVIVYQRLEKDFANGAIFHELPLVPPEWALNLKVILRGDTSEPDETSNLFLTNIQQIYEARADIWVPLNAVDALLGRPPTRVQPTGDRPMLDRVRELKDLIVINDEAHHVHDPDLAWNRTLLSLHESLPNGIQLWMDFSATPKDQSGSYYPWIVCDYPLAQAVEDRIVKAPIIVHQVDRADPIRVTKDNVIEAYEEWLLAALSRWKIHSRAYKKLGQKPVLFIMAEKNAFADAIHQWLIDPKSKTGLKADEVLVIHTDNTGEVRKGELQMARRAARDIDLPRNRVKVVVSVMMLREGWDVRSVSVVLGLRPFTSKAGILPEQAVGRGLRLMQGISHDRTQPLEVIGTEAFENFVRELEAEGVGIPVTVKPPNPPITVAPLEERRPYDISIPLTRPVYVRNYRRMSGLDVSSMKPLVDLTSKRSSQTIDLEMEFATTETVVGRESVSMGRPLLPQELLASVTNKTQAAASLTCDFAELVPVVRSYIEQRCFGEEVRLDRQDIREHLSRPPLQYAIADYLGKTISSATAERRSLEFEDVSFWLSETTPFHWRRQHVVCERTIFSHVATFNNFESAFARFLDGSRDVDRFAALAEHFTRFRVDYMKPSGALGFYYPDWVVVQKRNGAEINWIIETKGRVWEGTEAKDAAMRHWCIAVSAQTGLEWHYARVNQGLFDSRSFRSLSSLMEEVERESEAPESPLFVT